MKLRVILVCTLLLLAASPSFALPLCAHCNEWNMCESSSGDIERCFDGPGYSFTTADRCSIPSAASTVLTDYQVASIEISHPAQDCATVTAPAAVTDVPAPTPRTTELK